MVENIEKVSGLSMDIEGINKEKLKSIFPECFVEGKLDIDKLLNLCGEYIDNDFEKYKFEWKGKSECYKIAGKRSTGTLRPCPEESVNFDTTKNMYIEGDNLEVLKLLQTSYYRKVKMIYIDPPYNTGNDFVYEDDFKDPMAKYKEVTQQTTKSNPETMGRFHTNWLNMMYPRLRLASNLLRDDGVIFISIDDNEVTNLKKLCDEVFGEENFIADFIVIRSEGGGLAKQAVIGHDYCLVYAKSINYFTPLGRPKDIRGKVVTINNEDYWIETDWLRKEFGKYGTCPYEEIIKYHGEEKKKEIDEGLNDNKYTLIEKDGYHIVGRYRKVSEDSSKFYTVLKHLNKNGVNDLKDIDMNQYFDFPKPISLCKELILGATFFDKKDSPIILDFFSGSDTRSRVVMQLNAEDGGNRQFIMVQLPELCDEKSEAFKAGYKNICEIGKERIRRAGKKMIEELAHFKGFARANTGKDKPEKFTLFTNSEEGKELQNEVAQTFDVGFKVFKLDTSNLVKWDSTPTEDKDEIYQRMSLLKETIKPDRNDLDVVYEVMLKLGIPLDYPLEEVSVNDKRAYSIGEDCLVLICLDYGKDGITADDVKLMCEDYTPAKIVASEQAFKDDVSLSNAHYILKDHNIEMKLL